MIVFEKGTWQTDSDYPDINYLEGLDVEQPKYVVPDGSELAAKIQSMSSGFTPVEDENGDLIDVNPAEPTQEELNAVRVDEIKTELTDLDMQAIRPLRAMVAGTATDDDKNKLATLEARADELRAELVELGETN